MELQILQNVEVEYGAGYPRHRPRPHPTNANMRTRAHAHSELSSTFRLMLNSACWLGVSPIHWNTAEGAARVIKGQWRNWAWIVTLTTIFIVLNTLTGILVIATARHGFQM